MKITIRTLLPIVLSFFTFLSMAQSDKILNIRPYGQDGLNMFETAKDNSKEFKGFKISVGGDFAIQMQGISQENAHEDTSALALVNLGTNFNLPTANLNLDVQLDDGVRLHMRTYLSARHHAEAWVKGGYMQIDKLDFIQEGFLSGVMDMATIRVGMDELNYGDAHFRRSDNAMAIYNPFVGNYIMDAFSTEPFAELTIQSNGLLAVLGASNGKLNQNVINTNVDDDDKYNSPTFYAKLGYDKMINDDLRVRLTGSFITNQGTTNGTYIFGGDRAGSRYYKVMYTAGGGGDFDGRFNPRFQQTTAFQINPFVEFMGLEFFGLFEIAMNGDGVINDNEEFYDGGGSLTQLGAELLYRFGPTENFYVGGRYNSLSGNMTEDADEMNISRINVGAGWFMTKNVVTKLEYVTQTYSGDAWNGKREEDANFGGVNIEAVISF